VAELSPELIPGARDGILASKKSNKAVTLEDEALEITRAISSG
jgi:hypothetical protein